MAAKLLRPFKLIWIVLRFWLIRFLEFRIEIFTWVIISLFWTLATVFVVNLLFGQVQAVAGWTRDEVLVLVVVQFVFQQALYFFVIPSLLSTAEAIQEGRFDFVLTKPVGTRFQATFSKFEFNPIPQVLVTTPFIFIFLKNTGAVISSGAILGFIALFALGLFIFYCLFLILTSLTFWFVKLYNLEDLFDSMIGTGKFPAYIFNGGLRIIFFYIIPAGFIATFPVQFLLGRGSSLLMFLGIVFALIFFLISQWFWNFALKHYSSASS